MKKEGNFIYQNRGENIFTRHAPILLKPASVGLVMVIIWHLMHQYELYLEKSDLPMASILPILGIIYGFFAGLTINTVWGEYKKMATGVVTKNKDLFLQYRDEQIPIMLHILVGGIALVIQALIMLIDYKNTTTAEIFVFSSAFLLSLTAIIVVEFDEPQRSIWFKEKTPPEWLTINIEEYFDHKSDALASQETVLTGEDVVHFLRSMREAETKKITADDLVKMKQSAERLKSIFKE
jgi:hypothetical protein